MFTMFTLAMRSVRQRPGRFAATLLSAFLGATIIMTFNSMHDTAGAKGVDSDSSATLSTAAGVVGGYGSLLVFFAVGSAVYGVETIGFVGVALAFGLVLFALAYAVGPITGCHVNPAVTLGALLAKRGAVIATSLRSRPAEEKAAICASVVEHVWPLVAEGSVRSLVHERVPLAEAPRAHELMESGSHSGKILLTVAAWAGG